MVGRLKLPYGVTGFYDLADHKPPMTDGKQFKQIGYDLIIRNGGTVLNFFEPGTATNFYHLEATIFHKHLHILLNSHYPLLAFASNVDHGKITFLNHPELNKQFSQYYIVMDSTELNEPLLLKNENELNRGELEQIFYWKPETKGEVIFNFWD